MFVALLADQCNLTGALAVHIYGAKCRPESLIERLDGDTLVLFSDRRCLSYLRQPHLINYVSLLLITDTCRVQPVGQFILRPG